MKKIVFAVLPLAALALAAGPAQADGDSNVGGGVSATDNWNFTAGAVCLQEVAVVPVAGELAGELAGDHTNNCSNGNVIDHSK